MSKSIKINGTTYNGVPSVAIPLADNSGEALFREASEVIDTPTATKPITANGEYDVTNFANVAVAVSVEAPTLQSKTVTPSTSEQTVTPDSGYDGLSQVTVGAVQVQEKSVTPSTSAQTVTPDAGKYLSKVTVGAVAGEPVLSALGVSPTAVTVPAGTSADGIKSYLTAMSGTYTLTGYTGTLTKDLTSAIGSATVSGTMPTPGNTSTMTISYGGKSATVSVTMEEAAPTLTGLTATYTGEAVAAGTTLDQLNEVVKATYSDGTTSAALTKGTDYTLSGTLTPGQTNTITVTGAGTYAGFTTTFSVTVEAAAPTLTGLSATYTGGTVAAGTTLSQLTEVVKATYSDGTTSAALTKGTDYTLSGTLTAGQANTVTVTGAGTYAGFTTSFSVTVEAESSSVSIAYDTTIPRGGSTIQLYNLSGKPTSAQLGSTTTIELTPSLDWLAEKMPNEYILNANNKIDQTYTFATYAPISVNNNGVHVDKAGTNTNSIDITPTGDVTISSAPFIWILGCGGFWTAPDNSVSNENVYAPINQQGDTHLTSWTGAVSNLMPIKSGRTYKFNMKLPSKKTRIVFFKWNGTKYVSIGLWKSANMTSGEVSVNCDNLVSTPSNLTLIGSTTDAVAFAIDITGTAYNTNVDETLKKCYATIIQR